MAEIELRKLLYELPKTEIHLHLEGLASVHTIWSLIQKHDINLSGINSKEDLEKRFQVDSLEEFIDLFINVIQSSFQKVEDIMKVRGIGSKTWEENKDNLSVK